MKTTAFPERRGEVSALWPDCLARAWPRGRGRGIVAPMSRMRSAVVFLVCVVVSSAFLGVLAACGDERSGSLDAGLESRPLQGGATLRLPVKSGEEVFACAAGFSAAQVQADQVDAITDAPDGCRGAAGAFLCQCQGATVNSHALGCAAALFEACDAIAESVDGSGEQVPAELQCEASSGALSGQCAHDEDAQGYRCSCDGDDSIDVPADGPQSPASCGLALFTACAPSCEDDFGACTPSDGGVLGEYACTGATNRFTHPARAASCQQALAWACNPLNEAEEVCTGYGGYCVVTDPDEQTELSCTCADGDTRLVEHAPASVEPRHRACRQTLEETCGLGSPPVGAQCLAQGNGYHARCTRGPRADATLTCECYAEGDEPDARIEEVSETTCDADLLRAVCPELDG